MAVVIVRREGGDSKVHPAEKQYPYPKATPWSENHCMGRNGKESKKTAVKATAHDDAADHSVLDELSKELDRATIDVGLTIAELFKAVSLAAAHLPKMRLNSDLLDITVDEDSITVHIDGLFEGKKADEEPDDVPDLDFWPYSFHCNCSDRGYEEDDWYFEEYDCEEERLYDGD